MRMDNRIQGLLGAAALGAATLGQVSLLAGCGDSSRQVEKEPTLRDIINSPTQSFEAGIHFLSNGDAEESRRISAQLAALNPGERSVLEDGIRAYGSFKLLCAVAEVFERGDRFLLRWMGGRDFNEALSDMHRDFAQCRTPICDKLAAVARLAGDVDDEQSLKPIDWLSRSPLERLGRAANQLSQSLPDDPDPFVKMLNETGIEGRVLGSVGLSLGDRETNFRRAMIEFLAE